MNVSINPFSVWYETEDWTNPKSDLIAHVHFFGEQVLSVKVPDCTEDEEIVSAIFRSMFSDKVKSEVEAWLSRE